MSFSMISLSLVGGVQRVVVVDTIACDEPFLFVCSCSLLPPLQLKRSVRKSSRERVPVG
ncbi:MAG: hypothetical protein RLZZ609_3117 [Cyanobacteriota bacterium]|jgi:hypothetical protein